MHHTDYYYGYFYRLQGSRSVAGTARGYRVLRIIARQWITQAFKVRSQDQGDSRDIYALHDRATCRKGC